MIECTRSRHAARYLLQHTATFLFTHNRHPALYASSAVLLYSVAPPPALRVPPYPASYARETPYRGVTRERGPLEQRAQRPARTPPIARTLPRAFYRRGITVQSAANERRKCAGESLQNTVAKLCRPGARPDGAAYLQPAAAQIVLSPGPRSSARAWCAARCFMRDARREYLCCRPRMSRESPNSCYRDARRAMSQDQQCKMRHAVSARGVVSSSFNL